MVCCLFNTGCALFSRPQPPIIIERSTEDIIAALENNPGNFPTFRAWIKARITYPFEGKEKKQSFDAALLYDKEQKIIRLQGFGMFGRTYFDVVYQPNLMTVYLPSSSTGFHGDPSQLTRDYDAGIFFILRKTMEGLDIPLNRGNVFFPEDIYSPVVIDRDGEYSVIKLKPETLLIHQRLLFYDKKMIGVVNYNDYTSSDGISLPRTIQVELPQKHILFSLHFDSLSISEKLSQDLFHFTAPRETQWHPLTALNIDFLL